MAFVRWVENLGTVIIYNLSDSAWATWTYLGM